MDCSWAAVEFLGSGSGEGVFCWNPAEERLAGSPVQRQLGLSQAEETGCWVMGSWGCVPPHSDTGHVMQWPLQRAPHSWDVTGLVCLHHVTCVCFLSPQSSQCAAWSSLWDGRPSTGGSFSSGLAGGARSPLTVVLLLCPNSHVLASEECGSGSVVRIRGHFLLCTFGLGCSG